MSLRPGAVSFPEKWSDLQATISSVVQLKRVKMADWNDHYSYPNAFEIQETSELFNK